jgi:hypothetical protein
MPLVVLLNNRFLSVFVFCLSVLGLSAQKVTYFDDIQPIIYKNCVSCHRTGHVAPFPLTSFEDVNKRALLISRVTHERYMPPNPADPIILPDGTEVSPFKNVKLLTKIELATIDTWIKEGKKRGVEKKMVLNDTLSSVIREPDLVLTLQKPFTIPGNNKEQFRVFVIPTNAKEVGATSEFQKLGIKMNDNFWHGWIPGNTAILYPIGTAKRLPKNADIVLNMHYSPSPKEVTENSKILVYLSKTPPKRLVKTFILEENAVSNDPFFIPKDTIIKFYQRSPIIQYHPTHALIGSKF